MKPTIEEAIKFLKKFPKDATLRAYEGEFCGIVIENKEYPPKELGNISNYGKMKDYRKN